MDWKPRWIWYAARRKRGLALWLPHRIFIRRGTRLHGLKSAAAVHRLTEALCGTDAPQLLIGAEVHACEGLEHLEELEQLCVQGTRTLLLEMPFSAWTKRLYHTVDALRTERGMDVVLAHIERYPVREMEELMEELKRVTLESVEACEAQHITDWSAIKSKVKNNITGYLYKTTRRSPMILPVIVEV